MNKQRLYSRWATTLVMLLGLVSTPPVMARSIWSAMHPQSFPDSLDWVDRQCRLAADRFHDDALTRSVCTEIISMLEQGKCNEVSVPDGTVYYLMNFRRAGKHDLGVDQVKRHGHATTATRCEVSTAEGMVIVDYYRGSARHCNNVGIILSSHNHEKMTWVCRQTNTTNIASEGQYIPSIYINNFCGDDIFVPGMFLSGSGVKTQGTYCDWETINY
jgi:hypothetical protein